MACPAVVMPRITPAEAMLVPQNLDRRHLTRFTIELESCNLITLANIGAGLTAMAAMACCRFSHEPSPLFAVVSPDGLVKVHPPAHPNESSSSRQCWSRLALTFTAIYFSLTCKHTLTFVMGAVSAHHHANVRVHPLASFVDRFSAIDDVYQ